MEGSDCVACVLVGWQLLGGFPVLHHVPREQQDCVIYKPIDTKVKLKQDMHNPRFPALPTVTVCSTAVVGEN